MNRREFLKFAGATTLGFWSCDLQAWAYGLGGDNPNASKFIVIMLRGAVDGLSVVIPYGDSRYYSVRNSIAIPKPGEDLSALDLDGYFGLHPSLAPLLPLWKNRSLAFVHSAGSPDPTRSHFDAQDYMESGTPGVKSTGSGWMNRLLQQLPNNNSPIRAINVGETLPRIFQGPANVASYQPVQRAGQRKPIDNQMIAQCYQAMYEGRNDALGKAFAEGMNAHDTISKELDGEMMAANAGAPDAGNFKGFGTQLGKLIAKDPSVQVGFIAIGGWDTHVNQGNGKGQLANKLTALGNGLSQLIAALNEQYKNTVIIVMSEFGRTVKENGNQGTDHGHGNMMMVMGGRVNGGKIYSKWAGLEQNHLYEGRDLAVTTDFRQVLSTVAGEHMKVANPALASVFPDFQVASQLKGILA